MKSYKTPESAARTTRQRSGPLRGIVLRHYVESCACCGAVEDLSIDHVNGGGGEHREELFGRRSGNLVGFYTWLIEQGFPEGFQTLCVPCNSSKGDGPACRLDHSRDWQPLVRAWEKLRAKVAALPEDQRREFFAHVQLLGG